jgi:hypothetical protein
LKKKVRLIVRKIRYVSAVYDISAKMQNTGRLKEGTLLHPTGGYIP